MYDLIYQSKDLLETFGYLALIGFIFWLFYRYKKQKEDQHADLMIRALEKSENTEEVLRNMQKPQKSLRERLVARVGWGWGLTIAGAVLVLITFVYGALIVGSSLSDWEIVLDELGPLPFIGVVLLAIGLGFLISYRAGKKMLKDNE